MKTKIIALPTEKGAISHHDGWRLCKCFNKEHENPHHLYMLVPDAEIAPGDKVYSAVSKMIIPTDGSNINPRQMGYIKVLASTDHSLGLDIIGEGVCREFCEIENRKK